MKKIQITDLSMDELKKILSEVMNECMNTNGSSDSDIIGIDEVCKMTGMSKYTVYKKTSNREIPFYKSTLGRRSVLRFVRSEIRTWMLRHRIGTVDEVLSPTWFREAFSKKIAECMKKYFSMQNLCIDNNDLCSVK